MVFEDAGDEESEEDENEIEAAGKQNEGRNINFFVSDWPDPLHFQVKVMKVKLVNKMNLKGKEMRMISIVIRRREKKRKSMTAKMILTETL